MSTFYRSLPLCVQKTFEPGGMSFANSVTCPPDDPGIPHCERKCGCDNLPFPSGGPGDTAGDPSFPTAGGGSGPSPGERLGGDYKPVNLATGAVDIVSPSIGRQGATAKLAYSNQMMTGGNLSILDNGFGRNWSLNLNARIYDLGTGKMVAFFQPSSRGEKYYFQESDGVYSPLQGSTAELVETTSEFWLIVNGAKTVFDKAGGYVKQMISAGGLVTDFTYDSNDQLSEVVTIQEVGTEYIHNMLQFAYDGGSSAGNLESITELSYVGTSPSPVSTDFVPQSRLEFVIPSTTVTDRCPADCLHKIHRQSPTVVGGTVTWITDETYMYVYYTSGPIGFLKYVIEPAGYEFLYDDTTTPATTPDNASDTLLMGASSQYFEYDADYRVSQVKTKGGDESADITYDDNPETAIPSDPANSWHRKAVYTSNDGTVKTVYSSKLGADMLVVDTDGTDTWIYYIEFDSDGRPIAHYSPAAIDMTASPIYDEDDYDLSVAVKTDAGRIDVTNWYSTTGSGAAEGRLESRSVKEGSSGTPVLLRKWEYTSHTVGTGGDARTIYPVSKEIQYTSDSGGGDPVTTEYTYTWHTDLNQDEIFQAKTITTKLPNVAATQNGVAHPQNDTIVNEYNLARPDDQIDRRPGYGHRIRLRSGHRRDDSNDSRQWRWQAEPDNRL